jgi:hypothetical protein
MLLNKEMLFPSDMLGQILKKLVSWYCKVTEY